MKKGLKKIYIALMDGEPKFASKSKSRVLNYCENYAYEARANAMERLGIDDDATEKQLIDAELQAEIDGDFYEMQSVDLTGKTEDDTVELEDGSEIDVAEILEVIDSEDD